MFRTKVFSWASMRAVRGMLVFFQDLKLGARLRGRALSGGVLGTFWKPPSQNPFWEPFSEPFFTAKPTAGPLLWEPFSRTLPRTFSDPFLERCVAVRPLMRAPNGGPDRIFSGPEKAHKHLGHKQSLGQPGHRSSRPGTQMKIFVPLGFCTRNINIWPLATRSGGPPLRPGSHQTKLFMFMPIFLPWYFRRMSAGMSGPKLSAK